MNSEELDTLLLLLITRTTQEIKQLMIEYGIIITYHVNSLSKSNLIDYFLISLSNTNTKQKVHDLLTTKTITYNKDYISFDLGYFIIEDVELKLKLEITEKRDTYNGVYYNLLIPTPSGYPNTEFKQSNDPILKIRIIVFEDKKKDELYNNIYDKVKALHKELNNTHFLVLYHFFSGSKAVKIIDGKRYTIKLTESEKSIFKGIGNRYLYVFLGILDKYFNVKLDNMYMLLTAQGGFYNEKGIRDRIDTYKKHGMESMDAVIKVGLEDDDTLATYYKQTYGFESIIVKNVHANCMYAKLSTVLEHDNN